MAKLQDDSYDIKHIQYLDNVQYEGTILNTHPSQIHKSVIIEEVETGSYGGTVINITL